MIYRNRVTRKVINILCKASYIQCFSAKNIIIISERTQLSQRRSRIIFCLNEIGHHLKPAIINSV